MRTGNETIDQKSPLPIIGKRAFSVSSFACKVFCAKRSENLAVKKFDQSNTQPVTEILDGHNPGILAPAIDDVFESGRRNPGQSGKFVDGNAACFT